MAKRILLVVAALGAVVAGSLVWLSCTGAEVRAGPEAWQPPRIVQAEGAEGWRNMFPGYGLWLTAAGPDGRAVVLVQDGDILVSTKAKGGEDGLFPYQAGDGLLLKFTFDGPRMLLGGKTVCLTLAAQGGGWEWLKTAKAEDLASLRFINLSEEIAPATEKSIEVALLASLAARNESIGLALGHPSGVTKVLPLFKPRWLQLGDVGWGKEVLDVLSQQEHVETLVVEGKNLWTLAFLAQFRGLRKLAINEWNPETTGPFPAGCDRLETLALMGPKLKDFSPVANLPRLSSLGLVNCPPISDAAGLAKLAGLRTLILTGSVVPEDFGALRELKDLRWLGLPANVSPKQFADLAREHPELLGVEAVNCQEVKDLAPLSGLKHPEFLVLVDKDKVYKDLGALRDLKSLRLVVLTEKTFKEQPDQVADLKKALPSTQVVMGAPICLGSGWILLLVPAAGAAWLLRRWRRPSGA
jgi:hypothetical protein